jgi:hypothetical protein
MVKLFYRNSLWSFVAGPTIWLAYFLFCYIAAAIYCEKFADQAGFPFLQLTIGLATIVALAGIARAGIQAVDDWCQAMNADWVADADTLEMRRRFMGRAAFLLAGLSGVAVIYVGATVLFVSDCR